ncbi:toll-like receptor 7 isoform X2 [Cylas formicarius]|nr:toll-like receptor 7 isoform X2 [Cylas formicarius]XP_060520593.1 toll-like receptor 7 isoform X2 [Cylas formicarius]XP_060520594.1 toll-like receptor 7 isoform X2 [Cylas formicarius]
MSIFGYSTSWLIIAILLACNPTTSLNCDKEFTYFETYGQNGFNVTCNGITKGYEHILENITIYNEISLTITNSTLENITPNIFRRVDNIKSLAIVNSELKFDPKHEIFSYLRKIESLQIKNTKLSITNATMRKLVTLKYLVLRNNNLESVDEGGLQDLEALEKMELTENNVANVDDLHLCDLKSLKTLNLRGNVISTLKLFYFMCRKTGNALDFTINDNNFVPFVNKGSYFNITDSNFDLVDIDLSFNQILDIGHALEGLIKLKYLNLANNQLSRIKFVSFKTADKLERLNLKNNQITAIEPQVFLNKTYLKVLDISHNRLTSYVVSNMPKLEILNLEYNSLINVSLQNMGKLKTLNLAYNALRNITLMFRKVPNLTSINLCGNQVHLRKNYFKEVPNLEELSLNNNSLRELQSELFSGLKKLRILDLSRNNLVWIGNNVFNDLENLESLNISYNDIENLPYSVVEPLKTLEVLDISSNKIKFIEYDLIISKIPTLSIVYIKENPLTCDVLAKIIAFLKKRRISFTVTEALEFEAENIAGIPCTDSVDSGAVVTVHTKSSPSGLFNFGVSLLTIFVALLSAIVTYRAYIYLKRRQYRADEFELVDE